MNLRTLAEAVQALYTYIPNSTAAMRKNYTRDRMVALLAFLSNPQEQLRVVHIAGTSGKTSTAYFVRAMLQAGGKRTGLTVSPHINSITERVQVDGMLFPDERFIAYLNEFLPLVEKSELKPTYFEVLIALAFWIFAKEKVEYAVIETGLGGLLDSTNTIRRADKVCVISDIGLDHTEILGDTIEAIARQKAGIIQPGNHVILQAQSAAAMRVVREVVSAQNAVVEIANRLSTAPDELPTFQRRNWALAYTTYAYLTQRDNLPELTATQLQTAGRQTPPGRLEIKRYANKQVILDGAHNPQKIEALREALQMQGITSAAVLANFTEAPDAKIQNSLKILQPIAAHLIVPEFIVVQDIGKKSVSAQKVVTFAQKIGYPSVEVVRELPKALEKLFARPEPVLLITGSLYLISKALSLLAAKEVRQRRI